MANISVEFFTVMGFNITVCFSNHKDCVCGSVSEELAPKPDNTKPFPY